ncbi:cytochrome [Sphingomonas sp. Leaf357]|nr:cytochrome [Sphingomonas sp. Leaf357]
MVAARMIGADFAEARRILRDPTARQAGFLADLVTRFGTMRAPVLYLSGAAHRRQRSATARFFAPRIVTAEYRALMEQTTDLLVDRLVRDGRADLDTLSLELAVTVAAEIVGLTDSDPAGMATRLERLAGGMQDQTSWPARLMGYLRGQARAMNVFYRDVKPAIRARRRAPREDVVSHLLAEGYNDRQILTECLTYGAAGMITTREFITMAGWHLLDRDDLRQRFLSTDEPGRIALLEEILRLEPVVGMLYRRLGADEAARGKGEVIGIDIRASNADEAVVGRCPHAIDPDRAIAGKVGGAGMAFGDGEHRCPGAQVALQESAIFLDRLLRVPNLRLERAPDIGWNALIAGYELRGATLACGTAS